MKKYTVTVILEPHCKEYSGRRYLKMEALANSRKGIWLYEGHGPGFRKGNCAVILPQLYNAPAERNISYCFRRGNSYGHKEGKSYE